MVELARGWAVAAKPSSEPLQWQSTQVSTLPIFPWKSIQLALLPLEAEPSRVANEGMASNELVIALNAALRNAVEPTIYTKLTARACQASPRPSKLSMVNLAIFIIFMVWIWLFLLINLMNQT